MIVGESPLRRRPRKPLTPSWAWMDVGIDSTTTAIAVVTRMQQLPKSRIFVEAIVWSFLLQAVKAVLRAIAATLHERAIIIAPRAPAGQAQTALKSRRRCRQRPPDLRRQTFAATSGEKSPPTR